MSGFKGGGGSGGNIFSQMNEKFEHELLNSFPVSFIRDTAKINIPPSYCNFTETSGSKYSVLSLTPNWTQQTSPVTAGTLYGSYSASSTVAWSVGTNGTNIVILKTINGGTNWIQQTSPVGAGTLFGVHFINTTTGWAVGNNGTNIVILKTINGGTNWIQQTSPVGAGSLQSVFFIDANTGWAVGTNGTNTIILKTINGGTNWIQQTSLLTGSLQSVVFVNSTDGWAVGVDSFGVPAIINSTDGGAGWSAQTSPLSGGILYGVSFIDTSNGWAVGNDGTSSIILKTMDGGALWEQVLAGSPGSTFYSVKFTSLSTGWAVGTDGTNISIYRTLDENDNWTSFSTPIEGTLYNIAIQDANIGWTVGSNISGNILIFKGDLYKSVTIDQEIPSEILEINSDSSKKWMLGTSETNSAFITSVDYANKKINFSEIVSLPLVLEVGNKLEFYCYNRTQTMLNYYFQSSGWGALDSGSLVKTPMRVFRKDATTIGAWIRTGNAFYNKIGVVESTDYFATKTIGNIIESGVGALSAFDLNTQIMIYPQAKIGTNKNLAILLGFKSGSPAFYSIILDDSLNISYISSNSINYTNVTINGVAGFMRTPCMLYHNGMYKILFIHQQGSSSTFGDNFKVYIADFNAELCSYSNIELIGSSALMATNDATVSYIAGEIDVVFPIFFKNKLYIFIAGTELGYPTTAIAGNRYFGFLYNENGHWVFDKNGPTILTPRGQTLFGQDVGVNTHGGYSAFSIDDTNKEMLMLGTLSVYGTYYNFLSKFNLELSYQ